MARLRAHQDVILDTAEIGGALIVVAVLIGQIALPMYYGVDTTTWATQDILVFNVIVIVAISVILIGIVRKIKKYT